MDLINEKILGKLNAEEKVQAYKNLGLVIAGRATEHEIGKVPEFKAVQAVNPEVLQRAIQNVLHRRQEPMLFGRKLLTNSVSAAGQSWKWNIYIDNSDSHYEWDEVSETESYRFANDKLDKVEGEIKKFGKAVKISKEAVYTSNWGEIGRQVMKLSDGGARIENKKIYQMFINHYTSPNAKLGTVINVDASANAVPNAGRLILDNILTIRRLIASEPNPVPAVHMTVSTDQEQTLLKQQIDDKIIWNFINSVNVPITTLGDQTMIAFNVTVDYDMPAGYALVTSDPVNVGEFREAWGLQFENKPEELRDMEFVKASKAFGSGLFSYDTWGLVRNLTVI